MTGPPKIGAATRGGNGRRVVFPDSRNESHLVEEQLHEALLCGRGRCRYSRAFYNNRVRASHLVFKGVYFVHGVSVRRLDHPHELRIAQRPNRRDFRQRAHWLGGHASAQSLSCVCRSDRCFGSGGFFSGRHECQGECELVGPMAMR